jgi:hypothetical protein
MKNFKIKGAPVTIVFQIENTTTDAVSGTWVGPAYGQVVFSKASAENQMWQFEPMGVAAQLNGGGVIDTSKTYAVVQNPSTGFIGVRSSDSGAFTNGTKIVIHGVFVGASTDTLGVQVTTGPIVGAVQNGGISVK